MLTKESPAGLNLLQKTVTLAIDAISSEYPQTKGKLVKQGIIKAVPPEELLKLQQDTYEKDGILSLSLDMLDLDQETKAKMFIQGSIPLQDPSFYWSRLSQKPTFYYENTLQEELSDPDLETRSEAAMRIGLELVRFYLSGMTSKRRLVHEIWPNRVKRGVNDFFFNKVRKIPEILGDSEKTKKINDSKNIIDSLIDSEQVAFFSKGALILFETGDEKDSNLEYKFNQEVEEVTLMALSYKPQKSLINNLERTLGLSVTSIQKNHFLNGNHREKYRSNARKYLKDFGLSSNDQVIGAYLNSKIPEYIEGLV